MFLDLINLIRKHYIEVFATLIGTLSVVSTGMQNSWTAPTATILLSLKSPIRTTTNQIEWMENLLMIGNLCALPISIYLADKIGRKKSLLLAAVIAFLSWILTAVSNRIEYIFIARFIAGAVSAISFVSAPMYISEIASTEIRGFLSGCVYGMETVGCVLVYAIVPLAPYYLVPVIGASIVFLEIIVFPFMPESPYYLLHKNQTENAQRALCQLRQQKDVGKEFLSVLETVNGQKSDSGSLKDLFKVNSNKKAFLILVVLNSLLEMTGCTVILMNLHSILEAADSNYMEKSTAANIYSTTMLVTSMCALLLMDKFGRRKLLITSGVISGFSLLSIAIYFTLMQRHYDLSQVNWIPSVAVIIFAAGYKIGLGIVPIVLTGELFTMQMKAVGSSVAECFYVLFSLIAFQIYILLKDFFGFHVPFYVFSCCSFFTVIFTVRYIPETKGKTLDEIQNILNV